MKPCRRASGAIAFCSLLSCMFGCGHSAPAPESPAPSDQAACPADDLERVLRDQDSAPVIVLLDDVPEAQLTRVVEQLGDTFVLERRYASLPGFAGTLKRAGLSRLRAQPEVRCVQLDRPGGGS